MLSGQRRLSVRICTSCLLKAWACGTSSISRGAGAALELGRASCRALLEIEKAETHTKIQYLWDAPLWGAQRIPGCALSAHNLSLRIHVLEFRSVGAHVY